MNLVDVSSGPYIKWKTNPWRGSVIDPADNLSIEDIIVKEYGVNNIEAYKNLWYLKITYSDTTSDTFQINSLVIEINTEYMQKIPSNGGTLYSYAYSLTVPVKLEEVPGACKIQLLSNTSSSSRNRLKPEQMIAINIVGDRIIGSSTIDSAVVIH